MRRSARKASSEPGATQTRPKRLGTSTPATRHACGTTGSRTSEERVRASAMIAASRWPKRRSTRLTVIEVPPSARHSLLVDDLGRRRPSTPRPERAEQSSQLETTRSQS